MKSSAKNIAVVLILVFAAIFVVSLYSIKRFLSALAPDNITITNTEIKSSNGFLNPVNIEKLRVDSIGKDERPVKYVIEQVITCAINQTDGKPPKHLKKIKLNETGRYSWTQEKVQIPMEHIEVYRTRKDSREDIPMSSGEQQFGICPMKFEIGNWYFLSFHDPQIIGIYFYINNRGKIKQYTVYSGVSPI